jgi:hypothetical protein
MLSLAHVCDTFLVQNGRVSLKNQDIRNILVDKETVLTAFIVVEVAICAHETTFSMIANLNQTNYLILLLPQINKKPPP